MRLIRWTLTDWRWMSVLAVIALLTAVTLSTVFFAARHDALSLASLIVFSLAAMLLQYGQETLSSRVHKIQHVVLLDTVLVPIKDGGKTTWMEVPR